MLNDDVGMDLQKTLESRAVILANSGGGKSHLIRRFAEQAIPKVQTILIDPEGEFSSLRQKFDVILAGNTRRDISTGWSSTSGTRRSTMVLNRYALRR